MRRDEPRIHPLPRSQWDDEQAEIMAPMMRGEGVGEQGSNVFATLLRHPKLMKRWMVFANHCLFKSSLPARERELVILRTAWLARSGYEWGQHVVIGKRSDVTDAEIDALKAPLDDHDWTPAERALLDGTDELAADVDLTDATWAALNEHFSEEQVIDLIFLFGQYRGLAGALNAFGVQLDEGLSGF